MTAYPTENTLTINTTHQMLTDIKNNNNRVTATAPTRYNENDEGFDVELSTVSRLQFQYKRPQYTHSKFGVTFDINGDQVGTLSMRDDIQVPYLACPSIDHRGELGDCLDECYFINAHRVSSNTSLLYIPKGYSQSSSDSVRAKIRNRDHRYQIPDSAVKRWNEISKKFVNQDIGLIIRENGNRTSEYEDFVQRLQDFSDLYRTVQSDGGEEPEKEEVLNDEVASKLVDHGVSVYEELYEYREGDKKPTPEEEREALWKVIENMRGDREPAVHRISRSRELIYEEGHHSSSLHIGSP